MGKKMRMGIPKSEEDIHKISEEVSSGEHGHHEQHHHHGVEDILSAHEVFLDALNTRIKELEQNVRKLYTDVSKLYRLVAKLFEASLSDDADRRTKAVEEAIKLLEETGK